jgi:hypothetical protein
VRGLTSNLGQQLKISQEEKQDWASIELHFTLCWKMGNDVM